MSRQMLTVDGLQYSCWSREIFEQMRSCLIDLLLNLTSIVVCLRRHDINYARVKSWATTSYAGKTGIATTA